MLLKRHGTKFVPESSTDQPKPLSIRQIVKAYHFPAGKNLENRKVAVIELGGGYRHLDIYKFCDDIGVKHPVLKDHSVDWAHNGLIPAAADGEVALDLCILAGAAPGLQIHPVFGPNSTKGFSDAIIYAVDQIQPDAISISWGSAEANWTDADRQLMDRAMEAAVRSGISVCCAAGDSGSSDSVNDGKSHVDFPASSPWALGCGGTRLELDENDERSLERVWDPKDGHGSTGGGLSAVYPRLTLPGAPELSSRGVPDIAFVADPATGYEIKCDFINTAVGGTSGAAPLMAALVALLQSYSFNKLGDLKNFLYKAPADAFFDVIEGSNGAFEAGEGYDCCTGLGVPDGQKLLQFLASMGIASP